MAAEIEAEICVIGGGPAGAVTAMRLAQLGRRVCLLERAIFPRQHIGESLPASIWPILRFLGVGDAMKAAGFLQSSGSVLMWGGAFERRGEPVDDPGLLVDRSRFDAILLDAARQSGVRVLQPARAYRPRRTGAGWEVPILTAQGKGRLRADLLVDAAGKHAGFGRRFRPASAPLTALYAYWQAPPGFGTQARVEAGDAHWYWGAAQPDGTVNACVFVDPSDCTGLSPAARRDLYLNLLARSTLLAGCLEQARMGPVRRCDASSQCELTPPADDLLRVGEASFSVDALSSQGVHLAMAQAMQAAVVANTILTRPGDTNIALGFYSERQRERVETHAELAAAFYARHHEVTSGPFWSQRAQPLDWLRRPPADLQNAELSTGEVLRRSPEAKLVQGGVQGDAYVLRSEILTHPNLPRAVHSLAGAELAPLISDLREPLSVPDILQRWSSRIGPTSAAQVLRWLWHTKILVPAGELWRNRGSP
ncbi:flavin-dependent monooxygenase QhpG [Ruegeria arenilitoris]|uniref:flavin-dependent monooxygenase QhpG n=1 Tax=Ruegeria arenilitoris TaxID=1173585 RepID=UPI001481B09F|nr:tryptophan 7-halogenase [Ruegeria arenilitoris]